LHDHGDGAGGGIRWRFVSWLLVGAALTEVVAPLAAGWRWRQQPTRLRDQLDNTPRNRNTVLVRARFGAPHG